MASCRFVSGFHYQGRLIGGVAAGKFTCLRLQFLQAWFPSRPEYRPKPATHVRLNLIYKQEQGWIPFETSNIVCKVFLKLSFVRVLDIFI